jgi:fatty-acyl-CoA synthase
MFIPKYSTMGSFFDGQVAKFEDREALRVVHQNIRWTWKEFQKEVDAFALGLLKLGLKRGDST